MCRPEEDGGDAEEDQKADKRHVRIVVGNGAAAAAAAGVGSASAPYARERNANRDSRSVALASLRN